jgi:hypothetical protein
LVSRAQIQGTGKQQLAREPPTKRRHAEISVHLLAALVSSAGTILNLLIAKTSYWLALRVPFAPAIGRGRTEEIPQRRISMSNENLTVHFKVKDFNTWRTSYNGHEKDRASAGITNGRVFQSPNDPNDVVILQDVADVSKARTWLGSNEMKSVLEKSGVIGSPNIRFAAAA